MKLERPIKVRSSSFYSIYFIWEGMLIVWESISYGRCWNIKFYHMAYLLC